MRADKGSRSCGGDGTQCGGIIENLQDPYLAPHALLAYICMRGVECEERVQVRDKERKEDGRDEAEHAGGDRAGKDTPTGDDAVEGVKKLRMRKEVRDTHCACFVSSAIWPEASKPMPAVKRNQGNPITFRSDGTSNHKFTKTESNSIPQGHLFSCCCMS